MGQDVIDRIVARVETDIILLSDVRQLNRYQVFLDGKAQNRRGHPEPLDRPVDRPAAKPASPGFPSPPMKM